MKNSYIFWSVMAGILIAGIFVGQADWFKKLIGKLTGNGSGPLAEGAFCQVSGKNGHITAGVCVEDDPTGEPPPPPPTERTVATGYPFIFLPISANCQGYTTATPYSYQGCSYVFGGYVSKSGVRYCQLKKISCP